MFENLTTRLLGFARKNSGALIIGVSLIVGLNYSRFESYVVDVKQYVGLAYYHLSGQAEADRKREEALQRWQKQAEQARREQYEKEQQQRQAEAANRRWVEAQEAARKAVAQAAEAEARKTMLQSWLAFLGEEKSKVPQVELVRDTARGDYYCLRMPDAVSNDRIWKYMSQGYSEALRRAHEEVEVEDYPIRDTIADDFVRYLRAKSVLSRRDWKYADLRDVNTDTINFSVHCWSPKEIWRANR